MYDGRTGAAPGMVLGHEGLGIVESAGLAVHRVRRGDRVVLPAHIFCGVGVTCARGSAACLRVHPGHPGGAYAMPGMDPFGGSQAGLVRVPFADANCVLLPAPALPHVRAALPERRRVRHVHPAVRQHCPVRGARRWRGDRPIAPAVYGLARFRFRGSRVAFYMIIAALLAPITALAIPLYPTYAKAHPINSIWA